MAIQRKEKHLSILSYILLIYFTADLGIEIIKMLQSGVQDQIAKLEAERRIKLRGAARIRLESLHFQSNEPGQADRKNVERLKSCFQSEGCDRQNPRYHVPAIIDQQQLDFIIQSSGTSHEALLSNPQTGRPELNLPADFQLQCLHGRHRVQAGREFFLSPKDRWWTVDLYLAGMVRY